MHGLGRESHEVSRSSSAATADFFLDAPLGHACRLSASDRTVGGPNVLDSRS